MTEYIPKIAAELNVKPAQVEAVAALFADGSTVPFIARYRKEATGNLDEVAITFIRDRLAQLAELDKRRDAIIKSIDEQGKLTDKLREELASAETLAKLEDFYLPYRPKRRTRAMIAREKGLEPLAETLLAQGDFDVVAEAEKFIDAEKCVEDAAQALAGARDIIAEIVNEDAAVREDIRLLYRTKSRFVSKVVSGMEEQAAKYRDYFDWSEPVKDAPSHRVLAMRRGANEKMLMLRVEVEQEAAIALMEQMYITAETPASAQVRMAIADCFKRLLSLSMETEIRLESKHRADEAAIGVFSENLRELLLAAPLGEKAILALDPGFRTGCKLVCLSKQGALLADDVIYPHSGAGQRERAARKLRDYCEKFKIEIIAYGNGTASQETAEFASSVDLGRQIPVVMVNESGASIYSASEAGREEFPDKDLTVRGAVSIGRRLMDPLAELVKIDPKSIGVGQYQHDVDQKKLQSGLDDVVISCVNSVGVDVNTASSRLLMYVAGVGKSVAGNIVSCRDAKGPFASRKALMDVSGVGKKLFEQCAGFLRVRGAANPLDASAVHPESYGIVEQMAKDAGCSVKELIANEKLVNSLDLSKYVTEQVGLPTLVDIKAELAKPGRDPREKFELFSFSDAVKEIKDLEPGMKLPGIVTNVTAFGAFVDIGVHQDGLVHISELADKFVSNPMDVVKVQQKVSVTVLDVDVDRKRISLSMKTGADPSAPKKTRPADKPRPKKNRDNRPQRPSRDEPFGQKLNIRL
ncbi:MAG: Tex family protein [Phycisphaerae bacterium]